MPTFDVICPAGVSEGDLLRVQSEDGQSFEVALPPGVSEGEVFQVVCEEPAPAESGASGAIPAQLASMRAAVDTMATEFLATSLRLLLVSVERMWELNAWVDDHCASFEGYQREGEQLLEWTVLHAEYVGMVEAGIQDTLAGLQCSAEMIFAYAERYGGDPKADKLLARLLALSDYHAFAEMMRHSHAMGPTAA